MKELVAKHREIAYIWKSEWGDNILTNNSGKNLLAVVSYVPSSC